MKLPFGKFRGVRIQYVPDDYLQWLGTIHLKERLREAVEAELLHRGLESDAEPPDFEPRSVLFLRVETESVPALRSLVDVGYKALADQCHPDHGGDSERMLQLNHPASSLHQQLAEVGGGI